MVSDLKKRELLNFFGIKNSREHIRICIRCGSDNIQKKQNRIECEECGKIITIKS